jgi:ABC-type lipoprotein export system ATPase subunit
VRAVRVGQVDAAVDPRDLARTEGGHGGDDGREAHRLGLPEPDGVPDRTALDHVCLPLLAKGQPRQDAERHATGVLERFKLEKVARQPFRELSGGEAQRLMLARAVCSAPDLLLVDEPTAQLDITTAATVNETLGEVAQDGTIVVIATHDPHTRAACTHVIDLAASQ